MFCAGAAHESRHPGGCGCGSGCYRSPGSLGLLGRTVGDGAQLGRGGGMGTHPGWDWWQRSPRTRSSSQVMRRWTVCFTLVLCLWGGGEDNRGLEPGKQAGLAGLGVHEAGAPEGRGCGQHSGPAFMPKPSSAGERQQAGVTTYPMDSAQGCCAWPPRSSGRRRAGEGLRLHPMLSCGEGGFWKS